MKVSLLFATPLMVLVKAIRKCYDSIGKSDSKWYAHDCFELGPRDEVLIKRILTDGHGSVLEHINFTFELDGYSRAVLQELSRHRMASPSVKSTRYTLRELKGELDFLLPPDEEGYTDYDFERASKYVKLTGDEALDEITVDALNNLLYLLRNNYSNDQVKYALPEGYLTSSILTINARSFRNLLELRTDKRAFPEFQELARMMFDEVPVEYRFLLEDCVKGASCED